MEMISSDKLNMVEAGAAVELKGLLQDIQDRITNQVLIGSDFSLSYHGRERARYIYSQAKMVAKLIHTIDSAIELYSIEREDFIAALKFKNPKMTFAAQSICKSFETIFEIFYRNLRQSFRSCPQSRDMLNRFPLMGRWTNDPLSEDRELRVLRNASTHGAGTTFAFRGDFFADLPNRDPFDAGQFWDMAITTHIPSIKDELSDLIVLLHRDLPNMEDIRPDLSSWDELIVNDYPIPFSIRMLPLKAGLTACKLMLNCTGDLGHFIQRSAINFSNMIDQVLSKPVGRLQAKLYEQDQDYRAKVRTKIQMQEEAERARQWDDKVETINEADNSWEIRGEGDW
ncbi:hypothetical protein P171DRAFT_487131 [Karstenula rhodostoma CBS 690.94]|uniref:Uncharacterized protein n=1 Tax=Karstenula rhodostoma CBS 690.94 TaxID=1392251 RepID=A0A9P4PHB9_9PLEO|nr:hypothetical protein P171DRAFT_487131 [Karstenula rhodostoma CBS 690.94]